VIFGGVVLTAFDFNGFDAALCDDPELAFLTDFLTDLLAAARRFVPPFAFAAAEEWPPDFLPGDDLEDFLRDFVDIAFLSSLSADQPLGYCGCCPGAPESSRRLGKFDRSGVWLQENRRFSVSSFDER
jgi:hypothetical protein